MTAFFFLTVKAEIFIASTLFSDVVLKLIARWNREASREEIVKALGADEGRVARALGRLVDKKAIRRVGSKRYARYVLLAQDVQMEIAG